MPLTTIVDTSFGDTGKARIVDFILKDYDVITKSGGSINSGHTIVIDGEKHILRMLPAGVFSNKEMIMGQGVLIDIKVLMDEINRYEKFNVANRLAVSTKSHVLMPYHKMIDAEREAASNNKIGSTKNGIAICMEDKVGRRGIRMEDLFIHKELLKTKIKENLDYWRFTYKDAYQIIEEFIKLVDEFKQLNDKHRIVYDTGKLINEHILHGKNILNEISQGTFLDIESGFYPYVTSTPCTAAGVCLGLNIAPKNLNKVIGITKAYTTRVGNGPFRTQIFDEEGVTADVIRDKGREYGSVTKRPRRVGWLNLDELKYACQVNGVDELAITKVDVLNNFENIKVLLDNQYVEMTGWVDYTYPRFNDYIEFIEKSVGVKVKYISYGADRNEMTVR